MPESGGYIHIEITRTLPARAVSLVLPLYQILPDDSPISSPPTPNVILSLQKEPIQGE